MRGEYIWNTSMGAFTAFRVIYNSGDKGKTIAQLSKELKTDRSVISRELTVLQKEEILNVRMQGKTKIWIANIEKLKAIARLTDSVGDNALMEAGVVCAVNFDNYILLASAYGKMMGKN